MMQARRQHDPTAAMLGFCSHCVRTAHKNSASVTAHASRMAAAVTAPDEEAASEGRGEGRERGGGGEGGVWRGPTLQVAVQVFLQEFGCFRPPMTVIDPDECAQRPALHLGVVLQLRVGLNDTEGVGAEGVGGERALPEQRIDRSADALLLRLIRLGEQSVTGLCTREANRSIDTVLDPAATNTHRRWSTFSLGESRR